MNDKYWTDYYSKRDKVMPPSGFAEFVLKQTKAKSIIDFGAGDGRDTRLFAERMKRVVAVEPHNTIEIEGVTAYKRDLKRFLHEHPEVKVDVLYARWFLHAVDELEQEMLLDWAQVNAKRVCFEFRTTDVPEDTSHERRPIDPYVVLRQLIDRDYIIKFFDIDYGYSKQGDDDPLLARIVAERK